MLIKTSKIQIAFLIIFLIVLNVFIFYTGLYLGEIIKSMELEAKSLLPSEAKQKIRLPFPNYSGFSNLSSIGKKEIKSLKNKFYIQIGAFKDINNAKKKAKKMEEKGYKTEIKEGRLNLLFIIGEGDEKEEKELKEKLKKEGIN